MARILVVDDQPVILKLIEGLLVARGHYVTCCKDGYDAMEKIEEQKFEIVITDAIMPGGFSGYDLVRTIRKNPETETVPIILLTGRREKKDVDRAIAVGADDYVVKPVDAEILYAKIDSLLQKTGGTAAAFQEAAVSVDAELDLKLKIVGVSELGVTFTSPQPFHPNSKVHIESEFFDTIGIKPPFLRIESCVAQAQGYLIKTQFVGLTEKSLQPLRVWVRGQSVSRAG